MQIKFARNAMRLASVSVLALAAMPAFAQTAAAPADSGEIIVTATRRADTVQNTPAAITAFNMGAPWRFLVNFCTWS